jgi:hypothetical protein
MDESMTRLPKLKSKVVHHQWHLSSDIILRDHGDVSRDD